ncbi:MAG: S8 family peptidase [Ekhidna sp.]
MRGIVLSMLAIVWSIAGFTQKRDDWKLVVEDEITSSDLIDTVRTFLIEASGPVIKQSQINYEILRSIDENHHVVNGRYAGEFGKAWKVNDTWKLNLDEHAKVPYFYLVTTENFDRSALNSFEVVHQYASHNTILIKGNREEMMQFLSNPDVIHITNKVYEPFTESRVIDMNLNPNLVNKIHHNFPLLNGSTETISIQENNFNVTDIDLLGRSRVSGLESEVVDNHATEMATVIAGAGNSFITGRGVASEITITSSDFSDAMPDTDQHYQDFGIKTQNHSYGITRASEYGVEARAFDQSAFQNRSLLHVFSSGNEGLQLSADGMYEGIEGFANLTGNIKMTKNALVVGSVDTVGNVPSFVSRGPAYDGRVKPEVVAYSMVGSSNSAALVSGISALLQQQYAEIEAGDLPSALNKALLVNGAKDVGPPGLDFLSGYGSVDAWGSLQALRDRQFDGGTVGMGAVESFTLNIPANAINLKVTLCWTDLPANVNDFPALVNDLDLRLMDEDGAPTLPWVLNENANATDLAKEASRGIDVLNNVEQVTISDPLLSYTIEVEGTSVSEFQDFYIVWQYDTVDSFEWDFPTGSDNMPYNGETGSYFRWSTTMNGMGTLTYSNDDTNWTTLASDVDLAAGHWRWNNPPIVNDEVRARMEIGGEVFETDIFTISEPLSAKVGFNCGDSVMLRWDVSPNAMDYTISSLGEKNMEEFATTADTFLVIPDKGVFASRQFSIQPNLPSGKQLLPTPAFDYTLQGVECYVFSFFQSIALDTGIYLNLSLGTTAGIERIVFERFESDSYKEIGGIPDVSKEEYAFLDEMPNQGYNEHRATIYFANGRELTLSAGTSFYLTEVPLRIFPNPIQAGEPLNIITKEFENRISKLELVDHLGALVYSRLINGSQDIIPTDALKSGIYFYRLIADDNTYSGRILIR